MSLSHARDVTRFANRWFSPHQKGMLIRSTDGAYGEKFESDTAPPCTVPPWIFCARAAPTPSWPAGCSFT
jgi:hypothetical protein